MTRRNDRRCRIGFKRPLTILLPDALDVLVPPTLAEMLGYPCVPPERYVCFYWMTVEAYDEPALVWFDGVLWQYADETVWSEYVNHSLIAPVFLSYALGGMGRGGLRDSRDCLLLDTTASRIHAVPVARGLALARRFSGDAIRSLPTAQQMCFMRAAHFAVQPPRRVDTKQVFQQQTQRLRNLKDWLNAHLVPLQSTLI